jgi:hypothetical protein
MLNFMRDKGIDKGLVRDFDTSSRPRGISKGIFGFRKMFWDYLTKLHVGFFDPCCEPAGGEDITGLRFDNATGETQFWDPSIEEWVNVADWSPSTTTTTTAASTTTTTTA